MQKVKISCHLKNRKYEIPTEEPCLDKTKISAQLSKLQKLPECLIKQIQDIKKNIEQLKYRKAV